MAHVTLSKDFQVVIPEEIRRSVPLKAGQRIQVVAQGGVITLVPSTALEQPKSNAVRSLFAAWHDEDAVDDPRDIEKRREDLESFKKAMNANRSSERPIYP
jgi:AbrB family looped-hinge helix DNA binding protein